MTDAIHVRRLDFSYGNGPVLSDMTFSVEAGDFFIIIGPNGSGKTTLLKLIAGLARPAAGDIRVFGTPIHDVSHRERARIMALVPQITAMEFPFRVMETVLMGRAPHLGLLGVEQEADVAIARQAMGYTGVDRLADRKMDELSGGERQRVFIARALCQQPRIVLMDEPTASLDLAHQVRIMDLMERLKNETGATVVMVSHDLNLAAMYGDRLLLLKEGAIAGEGPPEKVLSYATLETTYGCPLLVNRSPLGKLPQVTLVPGKYLRAAVETPSVPVRPEENARPAPEPPARRRNPTGAPDRSDYPLLSRSVKKRFPFRLGASSYIYPGGYLLNAGLLGPHLDEIELLFLESSPEERPPDADLIRDLRGLAAAHDLTYNVHLPMDLALDSGDPLVRRHAVHAIGKVIELTRPLHPRTWTLHFPCESNPRTDAEIARWREHIRAAAAGILETGIEPRRISVETLDYPPVRFRDIAEEFDLCVCLDIGHLIVGGYDLREAFDMFAGRVSMVHLHGVADGRDHLSLDRMDAANLATALSCLKGFRGGVSLEVFSFQALAESIDCLVTHWRD